MVSCRLKSWVPNISGLILPSRTSASSIGTVVPSTSPIVMVTFLIQRSSRCSVAGAMDANVGDHSPGPHDAGAGLEGLRDADCLDGHVRAAIGKLGNPGVYTSDAADDLLCVDLGG